MDKNYPNGKLCDNDEGEQAVRIGIVKDRVVIEFKHETLWLGMTKQQALNFGSLLIKYAEKLQGNV